MITKASSKAGFCSALLNAPQESDPSGTSLTPPTPKLTNQQMARVQLSIFLPHIKV